MRNWFSIAWYVLRLKCEEAERIRCVHSVEPVCWYERLGEWLHRVACGSCRRARKELQALDQTIQDLVQNEHDANAAIGSPQERLSADARSRILAAVEDCDASG